MSRRRPLTPLLATAVSALTLGACGGSGKAPGVQPAPSGGATTTSVSTSTSTSTSASATATTPKPPSPLSRKPVVAVPKGPAPSQLVTKDLITGTGPVAKASSRVTVNYVGVVYKTGKEFDSSWKTGQPFSTALGQGQVIQGWDKGIPGMHVGGRRELIIPAKLAYGSQSQGGIPANSTLVFVVDLLGVS